MSKFTVYSEKHAGVSATLDGTSVLIKLPKLNMHGTWNSKRGIVRSFLNATGSHEILYDLNRLIRAQLRCRRGDNAV